MTIPYHTDTAAYGFVVTIANKPADQAAIEEMLLLKTLASQLYADFGREAIAPGDDTPIPGVNVCPFCGNDEIEVVMDYQAPPDYPYDMFQCDACGRTWDVNLEDAEKAKADAEGMAMLARIFKKAPEIQLKLDARDLYQALALVQLAARASLPSDHPFQPWARKFVTTVAGLISETTDEPDLVRYVEMGWDPQQDRGRAL